MPSFSKLIKISILVILVCSILLAFFWLYPAYTPSISSKAGKSIASLEFIEIGGTEQSLLVRSHNTSNPILLFLHGGPGMPMTYLAHTFQDELEKEFTVVHWDQRGAGRSYTKNIPAAASINTQQYLDDAKQLIDTLRIRYNQDKVVLAGHSFGTYLGSILVEQNPELFSAYISIGQVVDSRKARALQLAFIKSEAQKNERHEILKALEANESISLENWLFEFGGELKNSTSFLPLLWAGLNAPEYTAQNALDVGKGSSFSSRNMKFNVLSNSIYHEIREYKVPIYFIAGRYDYTTPSELIHEYYELISAPHKEFIWFEESAHFPFFEEPTKFTEVMIKKIKEKN